MGKKKRPGLNREKKRKKKNKRGNKAWASNKKSSLSDKKKGRALFQDECTTRTRRVLRSHPLRLGESWRLPTEEVLGTPLPLVFATGLPPGLSLGIYSQKVLSSISVLPEDLCLVSVLDKRRTG